jgi:hypothetical protein
MIDDLKMSLSTFVMALNVKVVYFWKNFATFANKEYSAGPLGTGTRKYLSQGLEVTSMKKA